MAEQPKPTTTIKRKPKREGPLEDIILVASPRGSSPAQQQQQQSKIEPPSSFVKLIAENGAQFIVPKVAMCSRSQWLNRLLGQGQQQQQFKESITQTVHFREISSQALELICKFAVQDTILNGKDPNSSQQRCSFHFPLSGELVLELAIAALFLEMKSLTHLSCLMLADNADSVSSWENIPPELILSVCELMTPFRLCKLESDPSFPIKEIDLSPIWLSFWDKFTGNSNHSDGEFPSFRNSWTDDECDWKLAKEERFKDSKKIREHLIECIAADRSAGLALNPSESAENAWREVIECGRNVITSLRLTIGNLKDIHIDELKCLKCLKRLEIRFHSMAEIPQECADDPLVDPWKELVFKLSGIEGIDSLVISGANSQHFGNPQIGLSFNSLSEQIASLELSNCSIRDDFLPVLRPLIERNRLTYLSLSENKIDQKGANTLIGMLSQNSSLLLLDLSNNLIVNAHWESLISHPSLNWLFLSGNSLGRQISLRRMLEHPNCPISHLSVDSCLMTPDGLSEIIQSLAINRSLVSLDVARNAGSSQIMEQISSALEHNTTLTSLNLNNCHCFIGGVPLIETERIQRFAKLHCLEIASNNLNIQWLDTLSSSPIEATPFQLEFLNINGNPEIETNNQQLSDICSKLEHKGVTILHDSGSYNDRSWRRR